MWTYLFMLDFKWSQNILKIKFCECVVNGGRDGVHNSGKKFVSCFSFVASSGKEIIK